MDRLQPSKHFLLDIVSRQRTLRFGLWERFEPFSDSVEEGVVEAGIVERGIVKNGFDGGEKLKFGDCSTSSFVVRPVEIGGFDHFFTECRDALVFLSVNVLLQNVSRKGNRIERKASPFHPSSSSSFASSQ